MIDLVENHREALQKLCHQYRVARLEIFGSAVNDKNFDNRQSDLDFLVEFLPLEMGQYADTYFGLLEALQELFQRDVDLVMTSAIKNKYFLESVNKERQLIYAIKE
jgi:predicted nucleotidyltransferase